MEEPLVTLRENEAVTTSLKVAEVFGKEHSKVLRDIRELTCSEEFREANFGLSYYTTSQNKQSPMYVITKDGFTLLVMGYTGKLAMQFKEKYIVAFNEMEAKLKTQQKPLSQLEILVQSAQALLEQSKRLDNVEARLNAIDEEREKNEKALLASPLSNEDVNVMTIRDNVRKLVNQYSNATNTRQDIVWRKIYQQLYYLYHISINSYKKSKGETNLALAERLGFINKIYAIISNMVREFNNNQ